MTIPAVRRTSRLLNATRAVHATESLTRLIACSVADDVLEQLSTAVDRDRVDSEIALLNAFAAHDDVTMDVSPVLCAILLHAQEASRLSGGLVDHVVGMSATGSAGTAARTGRDAPYEFDADTSTLYLRQGTVLDLWNLGCAWAAEEIVAQVIMQDPAASLAVVVGPAVVSVGAAWEISDALGQGFAALESPLRCGLRSFAVLHTHGVVPTGESTGQMEPAEDQAAQNTAPTAWWDRVAVGAEDAVQAITFVLMAQRLGDVAQDHLARAGAEAEFVGPRTGTPWRRRVRTPGWVPRAS
ncbi:MULTISPECIES: FAD:protein FMN transferase [Kocuria]|uniref:FAD:protein FMN transferase n=1 Tax=Kocuria subflava TaxID=1736139 RepID=A0A846TRQ5_9MICC|nr:MULTISPECIES: FAD:protein FMN transferase [Kocuria]NKE08524.1 FAD:protein FMN transferase [Kocuria subflava]